MSDKFVFPDDCDWRTASEAIADAFIRRSQQLERELSDLRSAITAIEQQDRVGKSLRKIVKTRRDAAGNLQADVYEQVDGALRFGGPYSAEKAYAIGTCVQYRGSAWCATRDVAPGDPVPDKNSGPWSLLAARGRDATNR